MYDTYARPVVRLAICLLLVMLGNAYARIGHTQAPQQLSLQVTTPSSEVQVGEKIVVEGLILDDGQPFSLGIPEYRLQVETAPGILQDEDKPIFEPARPEPQTPGGLSSGVTFELTAARPGTVTFVISVNGETGDFDEEGNPFFFFVSAGGRSDVVSVASEPSEPVTIPEPITLTLFGAGLLAAAGYTSLRQRLR